MTDAPLLAGVELGGTKTIIVVARGDHIVASRRVPTQTPDETLAAAAAALRALAAEHGMPAALGIATFGPVGLDAAGTDYGRILATPKPGWSGADLLAALAPAVDGPVAIDTDVNGAALAEGQWGAARGCRVHAYLTIGTGIGGGLVVGGRAVHGRMHPEMGHLAVRRATDDAFPGLCPFHGDCLEGLASGPAIAARAGVRAPDVPPDHPLWPQVSAEIAQLVVALLLLASPERITVGGGVATGVPHLLPRVRAAAAQRLGGYLPGCDAQGLAALLVPAQLGDRAGPLGAIALAQLALAEGRHR